MWACDEKVSFYGSKRRIRFRIILRECAKVVGDIVLVSSALTKGIRVTILI